MIAKLALRGSTRSIGVLQNVSIVTWDSSVHPMPPCALFAQTEQSLARGAQKISARVASPAGMRSEEVPTFAFLALSGEPWPHGSQQPVNLVCLGNLLHKQVAQNAQCAQ